MRGCFLPTSAGVTERNSNRLVSGRARPAFSPRSHCPTPRSTAAVRRSNRRTVRCSRCAFCVGINSATGTKRGVGEEQITALDRFDESPLFDERQKAALAYAEAMTRSEARVSDALMQRLKARFDDDSAIELTAIIALQNMSSKFNAALDVAPQGFCRLTPRENS